MKRRALSCLCVLAVLLTAVLSGCGKTPPITTEAPTLPVLETGEPAAWGDPGQPSTGQPSADWPDARDPAEETFGPDPEPSAPPETESLPTDPTEPTAETGRSGGEAGPFREESPEDLVRVPTMAVEPRETACALQPEMEKLLEGKDGKWSVYLKNIDTGETLSIRDEPMVAASLIKLYVAGAYFTVDPECSDASWCSMVRMMIYASSNEACNRLIDLLGKDNINDFIAAGGWKNSQLNRKMLEQTPVENYTSTRECGEVLEAILKEEYVSPAASRALLTALKDQERTGKLPAGVPNGVETANKTGELLTVENDVCIVWSDGGTYILCVMASDLSNTYAARETIVEISRMTYQYFNER